MYVCIVCMYVCMYVYMYVCMCTVTFGLKPFSELPALPRGDNPCNLLTSGGLLL